MTLAAVTVSLPLAAVIAFVAAMITLWVNGVRAQRERRRELYAKALEAVLAYREFPYAIRRRDHTQPGAERVRISEALRVVQRDLAYFEARLSMERHEQVWVNFKHLVAKTREVAGGYMRQEWATPPILTDMEMNVVRFDYSSVESFEQGYADAVSNALRFWVI